MDIFIREIVLLLNVPVILIEYRHIFYMVTFVFRFTRVSIYDYTLFYLAMRLYINTITYSIALQTNITGVGDRFLIYEKSARYSSQRFINPCSIPFIYILTHIVRYPSQANGCGVLTNIKFHC